MRSILIVAIFIFLVAVLTVCFLNYFHPNDSHKASNQSQALADVQGIANAIDNLIRDSGTPANISTNSIEKILLGNNPDHYAYLYREAFRINSAGLICDPAGQPYLIEIKNRTIAVRSVTYGVVANRSY